MNVSPYSTLAAGHHPVDNIKTVLTKAFTLGELSEDYGYLGGDIKLVVGANDAVTEIPPFAHPIEFESVDKKTYLAIDIRPFANLRKSINVEFSIRNRSEYSLAGSRALLQQAWNEGHYDELRNISPMVSAVFARWVPESVARQFGLDPLVQLKLSVITAFYFFCLFEPDTLAPRKDRSRFITQVARAANTSFETVEEILDGVNHIGTLKEYCNTVKEANLSVRLERFEPAVVLQLVSGSWFGNQSRELVGVALEHPPTFLALLHAAITDRGFYKTRLSELVNRSFNKGDQLRVFEINFKHLVEAWK